MPVVTTYDWSARKVRPGFWVVCVWRLSNGMHDGPVMTTRANVMREREAKRIGRSMLQLMKIKGGE